MDSNQASCNDQRDTNDLFHLILWFYSCLNIPIIYTYLSTYIPKFKYLTQKQFLRKIGYFSMFDEYTLDDSAQKT